MIPKKTNVSPSASLSRSVSNQLNLWFCSKIFWSILEFDDKEPPNRALKVQHAVPLKRTKPKIPSLELIEPAETITAALTFPHPFLVLDKDHGPIPVPPPLYLPSQTILKRLKVSPPTRPVPV